MTEPTEQLHVDELRQRLRSMGYLDAGVNRFVLGPATDRRQPSTIAFLAAVRVGALAAFLLGPAAAIGVNGRIPGLVTGARDAAVIAMYLGLLFGAGVSVVTFLASLATASLATERLAGSASLKYARPKSVNSASSAQPNDVRSARAAVMMSV